MMNALFSDEDLDEGDGSSEEDASPVVTETDSIPATEPMPDAD